MDETAPSWFSVSLWAYDLQLIPFVEVLSLQSGHNFCCKYLLKFFLRDLICFHGYNSLLYLGIFKIPGSAHNIHSNSSHSPLDISIMTLLSYILTVLNLYLSFFFFNLQTPFSQQGPTFINTAIMQNHFRFFLHLFIDIRYTMKINEFSSVT